MTNEQINVAIAQACGWTILKKPLSGFGFAAYAKEPNGDPSPGIPDYCDDLNAMHEAEKVLTDDQFKWYTYWVEKLMPETKYRCYLCATARHRAEAFVRSMGKWATDKDSLTVQPVTEDSSVAGKEVQP
jgi:hypothetical protein